MEELLTVRDLSEKIKIHPEVIYRMLKAGIIRGIKIGKGRGIWRFRPSDIERWIEAGDHLCWRRKNPSILTFSSMPPTAEAIPMTGRER
ncbi:MAG: helix-turn-helix domain-containing protein [bacterium]